MDQINQNNTNNIGYVDIHCHCLPGLDDGPKNIYDSLTLCKSIVDDGISVAIATPHQLGQFDGYNNPTQVRDSVAALNKELENNNIALTVMAGGDVRIDERICQLLENDQILTLADGQKYILLELPTRIFIDIEPLITDLSGMGIQAIISHPERQLILSRQYDILPKWLNNSAYLQITAGSLIGEFGQKAHEAAWEFLKMGWVSFVATDAHNIHNRKPQMATAFNNISMRFGHKTAYLLCVENPIRVLEGREIAHVSSNTIQGVY